jgi:hypothetical protein
MKKDRLVLRAAVALVALGGCSESVSGTDSGPRTDAFVAPGEDAFTPPTDAFIPPVDAFVPPGTDAAASARPVINELASDGDPDFVELYNPTSAPISLDGLVLADEDGLGTPPADATHRITFPVGTTIPSGGYVVIAMNVDPPMGSMETPVGPVSPCPVSGVPSCFQASFGIGRTMDVIAILASDDSEITRVDYAGMLMGAEQSYCRMPNGTGDFTTCTSSPGATN